MRLGLITYPIGHLKTQQVLFALMQGAAHRIRLILAPFHPRPERETLVKHRPSQFVGPDAATLAGRYGLEVRRLEDEDAFDDLDHCLITGGGLIPAERIRPRFILNAHPGLVPAARGLDAFKWSILGDLDLGNTLHFIDAEIDAGETVTMLETPVFENDDIETLAARHYHLEIAMLTAFETHLQRPRTWALPEGKARKRMPLATERQLLDHFPTWRTRAAAGR